MLLWLQKRYVWTLIFFFFASDSKREAQINRILSPVQISLPLLFVEISSIHICLVLKTSKTQENWWKKKLFEP